jgi:magnesium transporter
MIRLYQKGQNIVRKTTVPIHPDDVTDLVWIDLQEPSLDEITGIEQYFNINIPSRLQQEEIESSSRYLENDDYIIANSTFLQGTDGTCFEEHHVSFLIKGDLLVTYREGHFQSFAECVKKIKNNHKSFISGRMILLVLFEIRIDFDADLIENISRQISVISKYLTNEHGPQAEILKQITSYQEITMQLRENAIDKQRVVSSLLKSGEFMEDEKERLRILIKDINSLVEHTNFIFERLEYLQDTFLGLVNIDQNKIIKIFTVISVIFMPPTLIASLYGMNFKRMPELNWIFGYPFALLLMVVSSILSLSIFKRRKWL